MRNSGKRQRSGKGSKKPNKTSAKSSGGRAEFSPSKEQREKVEVLICANESEEDIARVLGISRPTLRKHFKEEIATGQAKRRAEVIMAQFRAAVGGNVSAQDKFLKQCSGPAPLQVLADKPVKQAKLGKKEIEHAAAATAGADSEWGDDLAVPGLGRPN